MEFREFRKIDEGLRDERRLDPTPWRPFDGNRDGAPPPRPPVVDPDPEKLGRARPR